MLGSMLACMQKGFRPTSESSGTRSAVSPRLKLIGENNYAKFFERSASTTSRYLGRTVHVKSTGCQTMPIQLKQQWLEKNVDVESTRCQTMPTQLKQQWLEKTVHVESRHEMPDNADTNQQWLGKNVHVESTRCRHN